MGRTVVVAVVGIYHVILVILFAYLFFVLWPAPWPPPPVATEPFAAAVSGPSAKESPAKDRPSDSKDGGAKASEPGTVVAAVAQDVLAGQTRTSEDAKAPKQYPVKILGGWFTFNASFEGRLILIVLIAGGLGAYIHAASSLADYVGNRKFEQSWVLWYLLRPFIGMALAIVLYVVFRAGFLSVSAASSEVVNVYGITAIAALAGLFSKQASDKLNEIFTTAFRTAPGLGDEGRHHKLGDGTGPLSIATVVPSTIPKGAAPPSLVITGSGFGSGTMCKFNGAERKANFKSATEVECVLEAEDTANTGTFDIAVNNPGPAGHSASAKITIL